jgi:hypothetical protein
MILKRIVLFRLLFYSCLVLGIGTAIEAEKQGDDKKITPSYFLTNSTLPN